MEDYMRYDGVARVHLEPVMSEYEKQALGHSWNWFTVHAAQRLQCLNFFLLGMAFMTGAYITALNSDRYEIACV